MGLNFLHLFTLQEIVHLKDIVFQTANNTLTGQLYTSSLELLLLELGCSTTYSWDPETIDLLATDSLIKATYFFVRLCLYTTLNNIPDTITIEVIILSSSYFSHPIA
jgi:hypothetical protein